MTTSTLRAGGPPRRSALDRETATRLAATEYGRYLDLLRSLDADDWRRPTDCPAWDVRRMAAHNLGMAELATSVREQMRQTVAAARRGGVFIDALTGMQVEQRAGMGPDAIVTAYAEVAPRAVRGRHRRPALFRRAPVPVAQPVGGVGERWAFGYLTDTILTRDVWMHRVDTARATGRPMCLTAAHDGVLVADVVAEWAARHGGPCELTLLGPAGGHWSFGAGGPERELDAVEFCRSVSGRAPAVGPYDTEVPF